MPFLPPMTGNGKHNPNQKLLMTGGTWRNPEILEAFPHLLVYCLVKCTNSHIMAISVGKVTN